jgi:hypothetical protein
MIGIKLIPLEDRLPCSYHALTVSLRNPATHGNGFALRVLRGTSVLTL